METFPQAAPTPARAPRASEILAGSAEAFRCDAKKKNGQRIWRGVQSVTIVELQFKTCLHLGEAAYFPKFLQASRSKPANEAANVSRAREATSCRVNGEDGTTLSHVPCVLYS